jgi:hypothetical protein
MFRLGDYSRCKTQRYVVFIARDVQMHGIEPYSWLKEVLQKIADRPVIE